MKPALACIALTVSLSVATPRAQTPPCASLNDTTNNVSTAVTSFGFAGPNVLAYQLTPVSTLVAQSLQIFTGNVAFTPGFLTLELWDNDPATNLPRTRLGGGTWQIDPTLGPLPAGNAWQGANLDAVVVLTGGLSYWIVWTDPGFSTVPVEPGGALMPHARRSGTTWTAAATQPLKWRMFCNQLDGAYLTPYGPACATSAGRTGTLFTNHQPTVGNAAFKYEGTGYPSGTTAILLVGLDSNWISAPFPGLPTGCNLNTDPRLAFVGATGTGTVRSNTTVGAAGHVTFGLGIPSDPTLIGLYLAPQLIVLDTGFAVPLPFATSNALRTTVY